MGQNRLEFRRAPKSGWPKWLTTWSHLGSHYPYYPEKQDSFYMDVRSAIAQIPLEQRIIDPVGIIEIVSNSYLLGNRTVVCGLRRSPWMAYPDCHGGLKYADIPQHRNRLLSTHDVVARLKEALRSEALNYLSGRKNVGILLSGGLDSRIVAGIVRELQLAEAFSGNVVALTWGMEDSRDVIYAREIAKRYAWDWLYFRLGPDILEQNIYVAGEIGAEFSPIHLHALPQVRQLDGIDVIVAGSYGDSVGRAEFSGRRVQELKPTVPRSLNQFGLIRDTIVLKNRPLVRQDAYDYRKYIHRNLIWQYRELEQEMHYMRRKLQGCMSYVAERIPLFQLFTAPETFALMWDLDLRIRDDRFYEALLPTLPGKIADLPWARTGRPLGVSTGTIDEALKLSHKYGVWLRHDLRKMITELATSEFITQLNIFNLQALRYLVKIWPTANTITTNKIDEIISWMASLAVFVKRYDIQPIDDKPSTWHDRAKALSGAARAWAYNTARGKTRQ